MPIHSGEPSVVAWKALGAISPQSAPEEQPPVLSTRNLRFDFPQRGPNVLDGVDLEINHGDRLLLQGASGSGKSTLAAVLAGSRTPSSGQILSGGLDIATLGARGWRQGIAYAPQFHENHILTGSFAFNALLGRD